MDKLLEAIDKLLRTCIEFFGPGWTVLLIFLVLLVLFGYRVYTDWRKGQETNAAIKAKDETIQVLAEQNRHFRVKELKELGWSDHAIEQIVVKNTPKDAVEARKLLENTGENVDSKRKGKPKK